MRREAEPSRGARPLAQAQAALTIETVGPGFTDVTAKLAAWLASFGAQDGLLVAFVRHTSASLTIQENADPDVLSDLRMMLDRLAPQAAPYRHTFEGPDDMPAHVKSMLTATSLPIPVTDGCMMLGTWQAVYLIEHRSRPHSREVALHYVGTMGEAPAN